MNAAWILFKLRFNNLLQYRVAAIAGFVTQLFWGLMRVLIFTAFYAASDAEHPMSLEDVITYLWLTQAFLLLVPWRGDPEVEAMIREGGIVYELIKPVHLYLMWFSRALAMRTAPALLRCIPLIVVGYLFLGLDAPASLPHFLAYVLSLGFAVVLSSLFTVLFGILLFWTISGGGMRSMLSVVLLICSGQIVPLPLFPEAIQTFMQWLPFCGLMDTPFRLYMGHLDLSALPWILTQQAIWCALIVLMSIGLLQHGMRRLVVFGG